MILMKDNLPEDDEISEYTSTGDRYHANTSETVENLSATGRKVGETAEFINEQLTETGQRWKPLNEEPEQYWSIDEIYEGRAGNLVISGVDQVIEVSYSLDDDAVLPSEVSDGAEELSQRMRRINEKMPNLSASHNEISLVYGDEVDQDEEDLDTYLRDFAYLADYADREASFSSWGDDLINEFF